MADVSEQPEADAPDATATDEDADGNATDAFGVPGSVQERSAQTEIPLDDAYRMDHPRRGRAIIINRLRERTGTDTDASSLDVQLSKLGFDVLRYNNLSANEIEWRMKEAACENHTDADCFVVAILSHGEEGVVSAADREVDIDKLTAPFEGSHCKSLVGKPKIFIIQACRGNKKDLGMDVVEADGVGVPRIPEAADFLKCSSSSKGYVSWRNSERGSWFVHCLCRALERFAGQMEFCHLLTHVNTMVLEHETEDCKKQVSSVTSTLRHDLYLSPKQ